MSLFIQLLIGSFMIGITVVIHTIGFDFIIRHENHAETVIQRLTGSFSISFFKVRQVTPN